MHLVIPGTSKSEARNPKQISNVQNINYQNIKLKIHRNIFKFETFEF